MAYSYARDNNKPESRKFYELSIKYFPEDIELLIEFAIFLESFNTSRALESILLFCNPSLQQNQEGSRSKRKTSLG